MTEWRECKIKDIGTVITGTTPSSKIPEYFGTDIPFVTPTDFKYYFKYCDRTDRFLSKIGADKYKNRLLPPQSVLVTCIGSDMGKVAISKEVVITNQQINSIIVSSEFSSDFVYYSLIAIYDTLRTYGQSGTAVPIVNKTDFENITLLIPPLPEQKAIAEVLSSLDDKIDLLTRQNKTLEDLAQTYFRKWFVEDASEDWEEKGLDEIADFLNGLPLQKYPYKSGKPMNVIKIKELNSGYSENTDICSSDVPEKYIVHSGDVIFSWSGSLVVDIWKYGVGALNQHLFKVTSDKYPKWFYYYWIKHYLPEFRIIAESKATTMGHIQRGHLSEAKVLVPRDDELNTMDETLQPLIEKIERNNTQILTLQKLRDTLLPKLISGEVRVKQ